MLLSYKWMGWVGMGLGSLCGAIIRASLRDANNYDKESSKKGKNIDNYNDSAFWKGWLAGCTKR